MLVESLLEKNWKPSPTQVDVPANPQIFGQIVRNAKVQGISYPSKWTGKKNIAIFPENISENESYIELEGEYPSELKNRRIDISSWKNFVS